MKKILGFICVMLFAAVLTACDDLDNGPIGTWGSPSALEIMNWEHSLTFNADGSGSENWNGDSFYFKWGISGERLIIRYDEHEVREMTFEVDGDMLLITGGTFAGEWIKEQD